MKHLITCVACGFWSKVLHLWPLNPDLDEVKKIYIFNLIQAFENFSHLNKMSMCCPCFCYSKTWHSHSDLIWYASIFNDQPCCILTWMSVWCCTTKYVLFKAYRWILFMHTCCCVSLFAIVIQLKNKFHHLPAMPGRLKLDRINLSDL